MLFLNVRGIEDFELDLVRLCWVCEIVLIVAKTAIFGFEIYVFVSGCLSWGHNEHNIPPPILPISLSCVPSSRSSSSALGEADIMSSSESILEGDGDGRSEIGVPGVCSRVDVLRDFTAWSNGSSRALSEPFRFFSEEVVMATGAAASHARDDRLHSNEGW